MPQQGFGQQRAALPNKLRRYARMHTCQLRTHGTNACLTTHRFYLLDIQSTEDPSEMIILTLARRESSWFSLYQRENLLQAAKQVDVRLRRNEGRTCRKFFGLMRDSWPAPRWWRAAPQPASSFEGARARHAMNIPLSMRIKDPIWSHSNETDFHLRF